MADPVSVGLTDDIIDVLVQTQAWKSFFSHCVAVPAAPAGCRRCGRSAAITLSPGDRARVKDCLLNADPSRISSLKSALHAAKLVLFTRAASGTLQRHEI